MKRSFAEGNTPANRRIESVRNWTRQDNIKKQKERRLRIAALAKEMLKKEENGE